VRHTDYCSASSKSTTILFTKPCGACFIHNSAFLKNSLPKQALLLTKRIAFFFKAVRLFAIG
jgi:hypothetical protein